MSFSNPDGTALAWLWDFGDGQTSSLSSPEHIYSDSGAFVPVLYLTNVFGVVDTFIFSDTFYVVKPVSDFGRRSTNLCASIFSGCQYKCTPIKLSLEFRKWNYQFNTDSILYLSELER